MNHDTPADPHFDVIGDFLKRFDSPAVGHALRELSPEEKVRIEALVRGDLDPEERQGLVPLLSASESALGYLARLAKGESPPPAP
jgi:hypothetical protein